MSKSGKFKISRLTGISLVSSVCCLAGLLIACSPNTASLKTELKVLAQAINQDFRIIREANERMNQNLSGQYAHEPNREASRINLELPVNGAFKFFGGKQFYYKSQAQGAAYYCCPGNIALEPIQQEIRRMLPMEEILATAYASMPDLIVVTFFGIHQPTSIGMIYPWLDVVSFFPPGIDFRIFEWYQRGLQSTSASIWSKNPFVDLATGWVMDVAGPVSAQGQPKGASVISVNLARMAAKHFAMPKGNFLLLSQDGTLVAISSPARELLGLQELGMADILRKTRENAQTQTRFKLDFPAYSAFVHQIAAKMATGASEFNLNSDGTDWQFVEVPIPEVRFRLLGFIGR